MQTVISARTFFGVALIFVLSVSLSNATSNTDTGSVWFSDHKTLKAIDPATHEITATAALQQPPKALAVDAEGNAWTAFTQRLVRFSATGALTLDIDPGQLDARLKQPRFLVADPYEGSIWAGSEHAVMRLSKDGQKQAVWQTPREIEGIALDVDESLWVLAHRELIHLSKTGTFLNSIAFGPSVPGPDFIAVDGLGGVLWVVAERKLLKFDINEPNQAPQSIDLAADIRAADVHLVFGTLYLASNSQLFMFDRSGLALPPVALPANVGRVNAMKFDARNSSLWISGKNHLFRFSSLGEWEATLAAEKEPELLAVAGSTLTPTLAIAEPLDGALTNNPRPRIQLSLGSDCTGIPCLLPEDYYQSLNLDIKLNGSPIGPLFAGSATEPSYLPPTRLPEGENIVRGSATDLFGHRSADVTHRFVVDTVAPRFVSMTPADGAKFTQKNIVISGSVDDAAATVALTDNNNGGALGGANFSFTVVLKTGVNTYTLTATDPAGNTSSAQLRLTYEAASTPKLVVTQPAPGASISGNYYFVTGTFTTGPNTGVTVNGVVAEVFGNHFFAKIPLAPGQNTITVTVTDIDGAVATQEIAVSANGETAVDVRQVDARAAVVETIAGTGEAGFNGDNGPAKAAQLYYPDTSAVGPDGSFYFQDANNAVIRRIAPDGRISTAAGNGGSPSSGDDGPATEAALDWISDIAFGSDGSLYLAEGSRIRRIDTSGVIQTIAGSEYGYSGDAGPAVDARFSDYLHIAVAPDRTIYVADYYNHRLRKIDPDGIVTTVAGNGEQGYSGDGGFAVDAVLSGPEHLVLAADGGLYLFDQQNAAIRRIDTAGVITTVVGKGDGIFEDGASGLPAHEARFGFLGDIALDPDGRLYLLDADFAKVRRLNEDGTVATLAGSGEHGYAGDGGAPAGALFSFPFGMAIGTDGTLYIADTENHRIRTFNIYLDDEIDENEIGFEVTPTGGVDIVRIDIDYNGDGTIDETVNSDRVPLQYAYPSPGLYQAKFVVTDKLGRTYDITVPVLVKDIDETDAMLRAVYKTLLDRLRVGDVDGALNTITGGMRTKYSAVFNLLRPQLATIVDRLGTLDRGVIGEEMAEYVLLRTQGDQTQAFLIYFIKSEDGVWRIDGM